LKADPSERITIPEIRSHPFFLSVPNPDLVSADAELDNLDRPLRSVDYIDPKIFANLQALWPDLSEETLIESLLSYEQSWAKGVYHRLVAHRERQQHDIAEEERVRRAMKLRARKPAHRTATTGPGLPTPPRQESASSTLSPPYHDSARSSHDYKTDMTSPAADSAAACASSPVVPRDQQILTLPLTPTSPTPASPASAWTAEFDAAGAPSIEANEPEVAFFQQVFDKLNAMDVKAAHATRLLTPDPNSAYPYPTPVSAEFGIRCVANVPPPSPSDEWFGGFGLQLPLPTPGPSAKTSSIVPYIDPQPKHDGPEHIRPLVFRPGVRRPAPLILPGFAADKENVGQRPQAVAAEYDEVEEGHSAWIVVQSDEPPARTVLGEKRVFVGGDAGPPVPAKEAKMIGAGGLPTPLPTPTSPGPLSPGRLSWLGRNPFKPRPAVYELLSTRDAVATRDECLRLLVHMKIAVTVQRASRADPVGFLRCEVNEEHERVPVVFRVDVCRPSANHVAHGYAVAAHLVHERGAISSFKTLYNLLRRLWEFDNPVGILSPTIGSPASSPAKVRFG
jgi:serine/threonine-protein kinase HSL1 (negative regulator of Swe1 kinase)